MRSPAENTVPRLSAVTRVEEMEEEKHSVDVDVDLEHARTLDHDPQGENLARTWERKWGTSLNSDAQRRSDGVGPDGKPLPPPPLPVQASAAFFYQRGTSNPLDLVDPAKNARQR